MARRGNAIGQLPSCCIAKLQVLARIGQCWGEGVMGDSSVEAAKQLPSNTAISSLDGQILGPGGSVTINQLFGSCLITLQFLARAREVGYVAVLKAGPADRLRSRWTDEAQSSDGINSTHLFSYTCRVPQANHDDVEPVKVELFVQDLRQSSTQPTQTHASCCNISMSRIFL